MGKICSVPISFLVQRGQGIKLTSFVSKKCLEKNTLMPVLEKEFTGEGYEGAIVLEPKTDIYLNKPISPSKSFLDNFFLLYFNTNNEPCLDTTIGVLFRYSSSNINFFISYKLFKLYSLSKNSISLLY